jgi:uncharacterized membrane protein YdfJ with MMPL/SSD domain
LQRPKAARPRARASSGTLRPRLASVPGGAQVAGNTAQAKDFVHAVYGNFPLMLGVIAILTFLLFARAFRSVVPAAKAVVLKRRLTRRLLLVPVTVFAGAGTSHPPKTNSTLPWRR